MNITKKIRHKMLSKRKGVYMYQQLLEFVAPLGKWVLLPLIIIAFVFTIIQRKLNNKK